MRYHSYLNTTKRIIESYNGAQPLSSYLKKCFAAEKKYGSKDRKQISALCYNYYRPGKALQGMSIGDRIITATFLCEQTSNEFLKFHKPEWNEQIAVPVPEKLLIVGQPLLVTGIFPWRDQLSADVEPEKFAVSFLHQPDLFVRTRPRKKDIVVKKLHSAGIGHEEVNESCISLPNATKLDLLFSPDDEIVIQDRNSQRVLDYLKPARPWFPGGEMPESKASFIRYPVSAWDCCAASGGKSILLYDILEGRVELTVSDIRESVLANLDKRFRAAGIKNYHSIIADLSITNDHIPGRSYALIICDAPCTGSGTWSRTPEQLLYFKYAVINDFTERQRQIVSAAIPRLESGGLFFYITCSVFKAENEDIVAFIEEKFHLQLLQAELLRGYDIKADTMFVAVFRK